MQFDNTVRLILESTVDVRYTVEKVSKEIMDNDDYPNFFYTSYSLIVKDKQKGMEYEVFMDWLIPNFKILASTQKPHFENGGVFLLEPKKKGKGTHGQEIHTGKTMVVSDVWGGTHDKFENTLERVGLKDLQLRPQPWGVKKQFGLLDLKLLGRFLDKITLEDLEVLIHLEDKPETARRWKNIITNA